MATAKKPTTSRRKPAAKRPTTAEQLAQLSAKMEEMATTYQAELEHQQKRYHELVTTAQEQMAALVGAAQAASTPKPAAPAPKPQAVWHEENGEKLLILNQAAADFFSKLFENFGVLAEELQKKLSTK